MGNNFLLIYLFFLAWLLKDSRDVVTYLAIRPPQASMKLSLPRRGPALPRRGPLPRPHRHCPPVRATGTARADSTAGTGDGLAPGGGRCWRRRAAWPMSTPSSIESTGCFVLWVLHLLLLCANGGDLAREVGDAPHNRVLIVEAC